MMETALATILVGLSVLAILRLITAVTQQNFVAQKTTTALMLADNIRELTNGLPYNSATQGNHLGPLTGMTTVAQYTDVQCFNGYTASPPIDAQGQTLSNMANWQQSVIVTHISPSNFKLTDTLATDSACVMDRVQVTISYLPQGSSTWQAIASVEWLKSKLQ
jgi:Tfp pilus assembly protein PilV